GDDTINVYFFPESGALIEGIPTQVAFKAIDANGNAVSLKNAALYEKGNDKPLVSLHSFHNGMGLFVLLPEQEKHYEVRVCIGNDVKNFALPETTKSGYRMQVNNLFPDRIHVNIASNGMPSDTLGVALSLRGKVYAWKWVYLSDSIETSFLFSKSGIPKGVAELTLFDAFGKIQAERKVFIGLDGSADSSQIHITFDKDSVHTESCHFSSIYFKLTRSDGKPIPHTSFSVSITDAKTDIPLLLNETACINLLLSSDLKGCIEHPEYYFENDDKRHQYALDLLMRIQGWRRYKWSPRVFVPRFTPEYGIAFDGEVTHTLSHKSYSGITVTCYGFGTQKLAKGLQYGESQTDSLGRFGFLFDFEGPLKMTFTTLKDKKKVETNLRFYRDFYPVPRELEGWEQPLSFKFRHFNLDDRVDSLLYQNNEVEILKSVEVKAKRKFFLPTTPRENIVLDVPLCIDELRDRGIEISTIAQLFKYYDPLFLCTDEFYNYFHPVREMIMRHDGKYMKMVLNEYLLRKTYSLKEPDLLNVKELAAPKGMSFDDLLAIRSNADWWYEAISEGDSTNADNLLGAIRKIVIATGPIGEVKDSKAWDYGYKNGESLFFITLFPHAEKRKEAYGQRITTIYGYNAMDAFYSPAYINPSTEVYDGRRTLMWMPDVYTDAQGIGQVDFYNSPTCRQIFIDAECVTRDGCIGSYRQLIGE
nr:hypothetical protein [Bacteroidaceae bacterium]